MSNAQNFDKIFEETIDEILRNVFEDQTSKIIMEYLEKNSAGKNTFDKANILSEVLPKILGVGSSIIEDLTVETLYTRYGETLEKRNNLAFADYIINLSKKIGEA
jgi:hypothetical protein